MPADYLGCVVPAVHAGLGLACASGEVFLPVSMDRNHLRLNSGNRQVPEIENAVRKLGKVIGIRQSSNIRAHK